MSPEDIGSSYIFSGAEALPNVALTPIRHPIYFRFKEQFPSIDDATHFSHYYAFETPMSILAKTRIDSDNMFKGFHCFETGIYFAILVSIIFISCVISLYKKSFEASLSAFWAYLSALLSEYHSYPDKTIFERLVSCPWLIACIILEAAFAGMLRDQILKGEDIHWIDSLRDLYEWKHINTLQYREFYDFNNYLLKNDNDTVRQYLSTKMKECYANNIRTTPSTTQLDKNCKQVLELDYKGVMEGTTAMIFATGLVNLVKQGLFKLGWEEDVDYHVSKSDTYSHPLFFITNKMNFEKQYEDAWDEA